MPGTKLPLPTSKPSLPLPLPTGTSTSNTSSSTVMSTRARVLSADDFAVHREFPIWMQAVGQLAKDGVNRDSCPNAADYLERVNQRMRHLLSITPPPMPLPARLPMPSRPSPTASSALPLPKSLPLP